MQGITLEGRANFNKKTQIEAGYTIQSSLFDNKIEHIEGIESIREFTRTPNQYGFAMLSYTPNKKISVNLNYVYTGTMKVPHFAGAPNQSVDEIINSKAYSELSVKIGYRTLLKKMQTNIEFYGGVKNILNAYQSQFDKGKNRDSNFIYGPSLPRTFYIGVKLRSI